MMSDDPEEPTRPVETTDDLGARIKEAADQIGGLHKLAPLLTDVSRRTLSDYVSGKSEPKAKTLLEIVEATAVSIQWLLMGLGPKRIDEIARSPEGVDIVLLQRMHDTAQAVYIELKQKPPARAVTAEAGALYNELLSMVSDIRDAAVVEALVPVLRDRLRKRLVDAASEPGTGKRSASSS